MTTIGFFNNKGGVGKTSLVYHVAWMLAEHGIRVIAVDLDPQANLTSAFLDEARLEEIWAQDPRPTIHGAVAGLFRGVSDVMPPTVEAIADSIGLVPGDLALSGFEDDLASAWPLSGDGKERGFRVMSAFARAIGMAAEAHGAVVSLIDVGPNLGSLNRAALLGCDHVVVPLGADLFSLVGLRNMGPALRDWRRLWAERRQRNPDPSIALPRGDMTPIGYVVMRHSVRLDRPVQAYSRWIERIPSHYAEHVLGGLTAPPGSSGDDPNRLAQLKDYRSLMPMAHEARKPMFLLRPADGALGAHQGAVQDCYRDFSALTDEILRRCDLPRAQP
ncbi:MAG: ParA family protein [Acetobacteraceae bacterium]|nr:ParA family protein [Acetobacteraceae bacterium]